MQLDDLDRKTAEAFDGYLVRKDLVRQFARQFPVPTYVVEFLLGRYCATTDEAEIQDGDHRLIDGSKPAALKTNAPTLKSVC